VREVPAGARFWKFALVGASGVVVNLALFALLQHLHLRPWLAIAAATEVSILSNFTLNVLWTWRDLPKRGRGDLLTRAALYHGAVAPVVAVYLAVSAILARYQEPSVPTQVISLIPALLLSYWLARRVVFAPRETWASLFRLPQRPLTVQEALDDVLPDTEEDALPELPAEGQTQLGR
jgi:dolichol-phosphate mannosyltransferase